MQNFKINWDLLSRSFIGSLFIVAGLGKISGFGATAAYINSVINTGSMTAIITGLVILIEVVVAGIYVYGKYKKDLAAYVLIGFTALATILFHSDMGNQVNMIMALKNLAIIGGIFATVDGVHKRRG